MTGPAWLTDALAGVMIATAAYCLCRMVVARMFLSVVPARTGGSTEGLGMGGPTATGLPGAGTGVPALALALAVGLLGYAVWTTDRLMSPGRVAGSQAGPAAQVMLSGAGIPAQGAGTGSLGAGAALAPISARLSACCDIIMCVTMGYMLITMF